MSTTGLRYHGVNSDSSSRGSRNSVGSNCSEAGGGVGGGIESGAGAGGGAGFAAGGGEPRMPALALLKSSGRPFATAPMVLTPPGSDVFKT